MIESMVVFVQELLALEKRIGNVNIGVPSKMMAQKLKKTRYSLLDAVVVRNSQECAIKYSICHVFHISV
jgi:hypothetical protein